MGLLGFGLSIIGKAVIGEAIRQSMEDQRREEEEKARIYNKFHSMSDDELFECIWDNKFTYSRDSEYAAEEIDNRAKNRYNGESYYLTKLADYLDNYRDYYVYCWEDDNGEKLSPKNAEIKIVKCINELYEEAGEPVPYEVTYPDETAGDMLVDFLALGLGKFLAGDDESKNREITQQYIERNAERAVIKRIN
jgi:hypothetical protein